MAAEPTDELTQYLKSRHLHPSPTWLTGFLSTVRSGMPLAALKQTVLFRLLATDITTSLDSTANIVLPVDVLQPKIQSRFLAGPVICQILDIEDIGISRWSQIEAIEAKERGETTRGREIIQVVENETTGERAEPRVQSKGPFKLLLQDAKGARVYALELSGIEGINMHTAMGTKLLLRNISIRRAVVMLEPGNVQVLGGKLEALDRAWKEGKKERLANAAKENSNT